MFNKRLLITASLFAIGASFSVNALAVPVTVFSTNFDVPLPAEISAGTAALTGVQGFAGLGPTGNQFGSDFLRSATGNTVSLSLNNLPAHDTISLSFLFAAIDSLDGTGTFPAGDFFRVVFNGATLFSESFANATLQQTQSYVSPPGVELARHVDLGFTGPGSNYTDSAYNFGADPRFSSFAHSASSATIDFYIFGEGNQSLADESWAMDNLNISVDTKAPAVSVPEPGSFALLAAGLGLLIGFKRRRSVSIKSQRVLRTRISTCTADLR